MFSKSISVISRRRWVILGITVLGLLLTWFSAKDHQPMYEATAVVLPSESALLQPVLSGGTGGSSSTASRDTQLANLMRLAESRVIEQRTSQTLGGSGTISSDETIKAVISGAAKNGTSSELIEIHVRSPKAQRSIQLANTAAMHFVNYHQELQLRDIQNRRLFLENQMQLAADGLRNAEADLAAFEKQYRVSILSPSARQSGSQEAMDFNNLNFELASVRRQIRDITRQLSKTPRVRSNNEAPGDPALIKDLQDEQDSIQAQLEKETQANPESDAIPQLKQQITDLQKRLVSLRASTQNSTNPEYDRLMHELAGLKEERNELLKELGTYQQEIISRKDLPPGVDVKLSALMRAREGATDRFSTIQTQLAQARMDEEQAGASRSLRVIEEATKAKGPIGFSKKLWMLIGFLGSIVLGLGIGFIQEAISNRISVQRHLEDLLQWPITTLIPHYNGRHSEQLPRICYDDPLSPLAEAFRFLRTDILLSATERNLKTIMVVTAKPEEGGSLVAANLAISLAQDGKRVILVDADLRNPALHPVFKLPNQIGLAEVLKDERDLPEALANTEIDNLALIPAGTPPLNPAELLGSWRMRSTINSLKEVADFVVFDTPSALTYADSIVLSQMVDGVLLVIRAQQMAKSAELQMRNLLNKARARVLGVVLNDVSPDRIETFYYHSLRYSSGDEKKRLAAPEKMGSPPQFPEA